MRKHIRTLLILGVYLAFVLNGCSILKSLTEQTPLQVYTFNYDGKDYSVALPKHIPLPSENAQLVPQCYWSGVCVMHVQYMAGGKPFPSLPVASFWFAPKRDIIGLVWHTLEIDGTQKHECFLYVEGIPVQASIKDFNEFLDELPLK